jgi:large subunit ribosomal protein L4
MELEVYTISGSKTDRKVVLDESIYGIEPNDHAIYLDVKQHMANKRQGTHSSLEKSAISGSTRKLHKQKGTGGSRKGSIKNPLFRGGARVFGPHPRDYDFKLNKKILIVMPSLDDNIILSSRNLKKVRITRASDLNTYEILDANRLLILEGSVKEIETIHQN